MRILALSGSLQASSSNTALLRAAARACPPETDFSISTSTGLLPHFNPDLDREPADAEVARFRAELRAADAIVIATPEYAHGMPGALKNALDWVVGSGELYRKPVAVMSASPSEMGGDKALAWLTQTLNAQGANILASLKVPFIRKKISGGEISDQTALHEIEGWLRSLIEGATVSKTDLP